MAESAEGGSRTIVSKELSDPIRSHKDIQKDAGEAMAESAEVGSGTTLSKELSDPIRSHKDIHQDAGEAMAESAEVGSGTTLSKELSDPIRSHKDIHQDAVPFYHEAVKFCKDLAADLLTIVVKLFVFALDPVVMVVGHFVMQDGIAKTHHGIKITFGMDLVQLIAMWVIVFNVIIVWSIFDRAAWRYLLSFQFVQLLYLQLNLPWTFEFPLPLIFGFQRPWTIPAFVIDFLEQIFTNDPAGAPPTWFLDTVLLFNIAIVLSSLGEVVLCDLYAGYAGVEFKFPIAQDQVENPGGSRSWMQEESVALEEIAIWERPLNPLRWLYSGGKRKGSGVFKHDFIVIKLACGEFFTVEKVADAPKYVKFTRKKGTQTGATCRFSMQLKGATVPVVELGHVLGEEGRLYHVLMGNCWSYAFNTTRKVIFLCCGDSNLDTEKRKFLYKDADRLEKAKRTHPTTIVGWATITFSVLFIAYNMPVIGVTDKPWWMRWPRRLLQCNKPYWNPHSKLT